MKSRIPILVLLLSVIIKTAYSQDSTLARKNAVNMEFLGSCGYYSINYERVLKTKDQINISVELGFCAQTIGFSAGGLQIPIHINCIFNKYLIMPEIDLGISNAIEFHPVWPNNLEERKQKSIYSTVSPPYTPLITPRFGGRWISKSNRILIKAMYTPIYNPLRYGGYYFHWFGMTLGYIF